MTRPHFIPVVAVLAGCVASPSQWSAYQAVTRAVPAVTGRVDFSVAPYGVRATSAEITTSAAIAIIDPQTRHAVASSLTDAAGNFTLTLSGFSPTDGKAYVLEAIKGLSQGGTPNRIGTPAAAVRTLLFWNGGWQSLSNSTLNTGIVLSVATTAVALAAGLRQQAGLSVTLSSLIDKVHGGTFTDAGGLTNAADFGRIHPLVSNAISLDLDPAGSITYGNGTYALATGNPWVASFMPALPTPGGTVTLRGANFDALDGRNAFFFGQVAASTWSVAPDRSRVTVAVPANAVSGPFTLVQPGGTLQTITPFLPLHGTVWTVAGSGAYGFADGQGTNATFGGLRGFAMHTSGNLLVADYPSARVRMVTPGGAVSTFAGSSAGYVDGPIATAKLNSPHGMAVDPAGNVYLADYNNCRIRVISPSTGTVSTLAGSGTSACVDGTGTGASFQTPVSLALDGAGALYVADTWAHRIRKVVLATGVVTTIAGNGTAASVDGVGPASQINAPTSLAGDGAGNLYVTDYLGNRIRKIVLATYTVSTLAGSGTAGAADGTGTAAQFNAPVSITMGPDGNLYVTDLNNNKIRRVTPTGVVTTVAGTGAAGYQDGLATAATFNAPWGGIAADAAGNLYIGDTANYRIRMLTP